MQQKCDIRTAWFDFYTQYYRQNETQRCTVIYSLIKECAAVCQNHAQCFMEELKWSMVLLLLRIKKTTLWDMLFQENNQLQGVNTVCFIALNIQGHIQSQQLKSIFTQGKLRAFRVCEQ